MNDWMFKPGDQLGRYEIVEPIGKGRFGEVYLAKHFVWGRVALKLFTDPNLTYDALLDEAYTMVAFNHHPHIVSIYEARFINDYPILAMEYMEGGTLRKKITKEGFLEPRKASSIIRQLCYGSRAIYEKGFIHRDIKPENAFLTRSGKVKLGDLGCAVFLKDERAKLAAGALPYLPPEVVRGEGHCPESDIYSLGVVLYELLTGSLPFKIYGFEELEELVQKGTKVKWPKDPPQEVPQALRNITLKATAFSPEGRYHKVEEMLDKLEWFEFGVGTTILTTDTEIYLGSKDPLEILIEKIESYKEKVDAEIFIQVFKSREEEIMRGLKEEMKGIIYSSLGDSLALKNFYLGLEHLFLTLTMRRDSFFYQLLTKNGKSPREFGSEIRNQVGGIKNVEKRSILSPRLEQMLQKAKKRYAEGIGEKEFTGEALKERCFVTLLLEDEGLDLEAIQKEVLNEI